MKFIYLLVFFCLVFGQNSNAQETLNTTGADASNGAESISFSVGQMVYSTTENSNGSINEGVQQPFEIYTTKINTKTKNNFTLNLFPNPTNNSINLHLDNKGNATFFYKLSDNLGRVLKEEKIMSSETKIEMEQLASGNYYLLVGTATENVQSFKIIKN